MVYNYSSLKFVYMINNKSKEEFLKKYAEENDREAQGLTLDQIRFYIESYWPLKHGGKAFPHEVMLKEGTLQSNKEILQEAFIKNEKRNNKDVDFIKYLICVGLDSENKPHSEAVVYGVVDNERFAVTEGVSCSAQLNQILNKSGLFLDVKVVGIKTQSDYINCGVFCIELVKHLGKDDVKNILQKTVEYYSEDFSLMGGKNCVNIVKNVYKYVPAAFASYKQSLKEEMKDFLQTKRDALMSAKKNENKSDETQNEKIARKIIHSYGINNHQETVEVNYRANLKRQTIQWNYNREQNKNNNPINRSEEKKNCLIF